MKEFTKIKNEELSRGVASLPLRPNQTSQFGQPPLSGKQLQERFDYLAKGVLATKINELIDILSSTDVLSYFKITNEESLAAFVGTLKKNLIGNQLAATDPAEGDKKTVDIILATLYSAIEAVKTFTAYAEGGKTIADIYATIEALSGAKTDAISTASTNADTKISTHNSSDTAHSDIRSAITKAKGDAISTADSNAKSEITAHNTNDIAHNDIRLKLKALADRINAVLDSDDDTLDELSEIVAYIKSNKDLIDAITSSKVSVDDIIDNLTTNLTKKPLSAAQGVALKALVDALTTTTTNLSNDLTKEKAKIEDKLDKTSVVDNLYTEDSDKALSAKQGALLAKRLAELGTGGSGGFTEEINNQILEVFGTDGSFGLEYEIEEATATFIGIGDCSGGDVKIGSRARGIPVTAIAEGALRGNDTIIHLTIPDSVVSLGQYMIAGCPSLVEASIGNGVSTISSHAFDGCQQLTTVYIGSNVTKINSSAFADTNITTVYYAGTEEQWNAINFTTGNELLTAATIHYGVNPKEARYGRSI